MRLTTDQVKQGILHPEQLVRDVALRHFTESFSPDPTIMPLAIQAIQTYGWEEAFRLAHGLSDLVQTEETFLWLIDQLNRLDRPRATEDAELCWRLSSIIAAADVSLLMEHEAKVLGLEYLEAENTKAIAERLRLLTVDTETCWRELEHFCQDSKSSRYLKDVDLPHAIRLVEAIARDDASAERVLFLLAQRIEDYEDNPMAWMEGLATRMAGELRLEAAAPMLVAKLLEDSGDYVNEGCQRAFIKVGTDTIVETICRDWASAPWHYKLYASSALEHIHSDLTVSKCLELLEREESSDIRVSLIGAALGSFSSDGIGPAWELSHRGIHELRRDLVGAAMLMGLSFPELEQWKDEVKKHDERVKQRMQSLMADPPPEAKPKSPSFDHLIEPPPQPAIARKEKVGRNDPCPCGSGKKYKKCCLGKK